MTEKARQEMKRKAFEKLPEVADSLSEHIVFIGNKYTTPNQGFYDLVNWLNGAWYAWQAAQEQILKNLYTRKMVCAIENRVQDQMDASGVQEPLHRLDGWTIVDSIVEKLDFHHLHGTHVLVPKEPNEDMVINALAVIATGISKRSIDDEIRMLWAKMLEAAQESANA